VVWPVVVEQVCSVKVPVQVVVSLVVAGVVLAVVVVPVGPMVARPLPLQLQRLECGLEFVGVKLQVGAH
jgi:hypothetical protein